MQIWETANKLNGAIRYYFQMKNPKRKIAGHTE